MRIAGDTWGGSNGAAWDSLWTTSWLGAAGTVDTQSGKGRALTLGTGAFANALRAVRTDSRHADVDIVYEVTFDATGEGSTAVYARSSGDWPVDGGYAPTNGYEFQVDPGTTNNLHFWRFDSGTPTETHLASKTISASGTYVIRFRLEGVLIKGKVWAFGTAEPSAWDIETSNTNHTVGVVQYRTLNGPSGLVTDHRLDGFHIDDMASGARRPGPPGLFRPVWMRPARPLLVGYDAAPETPSTASTVVGTLVTGVVSVAVQAAFGHDASDVLTEGDWTDLSNLVSVTVDRPASRNLGVLVRWEAGTCRVVLDNQDRRYDPANLDGPYVSDTETQLQPMTPIRVIAQAPVNVDGDLVDLAGDGGLYDSDFPIFRGFADSWVTVYSGRALTSETVLSATDGTKVLARFNGPEQASAGAGELAGARVTRVLDNAGWADELRSIETGVATLQATTLAQPAWTELLLTADSERGDLFFNGAGELTFLDRTHRVVTEESAVPQADWDDAYDGTLRFARPQLSVDETLIRNTVTIANVGGTEQTATDATSQARFLPLGLKRTDLLLQSDGAALSYADAILAQLKDPHLRLDGFDYSPGSLPEQLVAASVVLGAQPADRWKFRFTPPGGGQRVILDVWVAGMHWRFSPAGWGASFTFQAIDARVDQGFTLDNPTFGLLDSAVEMAY